ncbi:hypothetical protein [Paenibacillus prosopidis]|uniref:Uncharacterized protein n=1 Tax=Paenibacillus prosopidis TaxID=630520 RepID=A0A368VJN8_9BACL|nr:hypothetical protein [Paenibacillus prosopidis]RCW41518.1 hypothetical protein DFP97_12347 [Paenibacillus prosopidis]
MILYPPIHFDANEWFILVISVASWGIFLLLPNRLSYVTLFIIWLFNGLLAFTADFSLGVKPFDLYDFGDRPEFEWFDVILYLFTYPPTPFFMLHFYSKWRPTGWRFVGYILLFSLATTGLEGISTYGFHVFTYKGWKLWYSGPIYLIIFSLNFLVYHFVQRYVPERKNNSPFKRRYGSAVFESHYLNGEGGNKSLRRTKT